MVDVVRLLIGEVQSVSATGVPSNESPTEALTVHLRGEDGRHAEIRLVAGMPEPARLIASTVDGPITLEHDLDFHGPSRLIRRSARDGEVITELGHWDPRTAILRVLEDAHADAEPSPGLTDGTRSMEVTEATGRSLRKGRTIDLFYEEMNEVGTFKSIMTSVGCAILLGAILVMFIAVAATGLGIAQAAYIAWIIPPALVAFVLFQLFRYGIKAPATAAKGLPDPDRIGKV